MPNCNFQFFLNAYNDLSPTSAPSLNNFKWLREINGVPYTLENSQQIQVPANTTTSNVLPYTFSNPVATSTGTLNSTETVAITGSTTGIAIGQLVVGSGIPANTVVTGFSGSTVTLSNPATATATGVTLTFYLPAAFVYLESDQQISVIYNGGTAMTLNPFQINGTTQPGVFFMAGPATSLTVTNNGSVAANVFFASMG